MNKKKNVPIPDEVIVQASLIMAEIQSLLDPYLIELSPEQYIETQKSINDNQSPDQRSHSYNAEEEDLSKKERLIQNIKIYNQLLPLCEDFSRLSKKLDDTIMDAGAKSFANSIDYYDTVKYAAQSPTNITNSKLNIQLNQVSEEGSYANQ